MNNWQPINTAPKDRRILLAYPKLLDMGTNVLVGSYKFPIHDKEGLWYPTFAHFMSFSLSWAIENQPIAWQELPVFDGVIDER